MVDDKTAFQVRHNTRRTTIDNKSRVPPPAPDNIVKMSQVACILA